MSGAGSGHHKPDLSSGWKRKRLRWISAAAAATAGTVPGSEILARFLLDRTCRRLARRDDLAFGLSSPFIMRALGSRLTLEIDPRRIKTWLPVEFRLGDRHWYLRDRFLGTGDWTPLMLSVDRQPAAIEVHELFAAGLEAAQTATYQRLQAAVRAQGAVRHLGSRIDGVQSLDRYFQRQIALIESIRKQGVLSRRSVSREAPAGGRTLWRDASEHDIGVAVDANGVVHRFSSGAHRFAIALHLGLTRVPVSVRLVAAPWIEKLAEPANVSPSDALCRGLKSLPGDNPLGR